MKVLSINKAHVKIFGDIVNNYKTKTSFPKKDNWKELDNRGLWLRLVGQVMVVGGSAGEERFMMNAKLKRLVDYNVLMKLTDPERRNAINYVMRTAGVRYASNTIEKCNKTCALIHNFKFISELKGGFKEMIKHLAGMKDEMDRVNYLIKNLKYIKNKSARDFLMGLGMNRGTLAIDIRIQNIFKHVGIPFPTAEEVARKSVYLPIERQIIDSVCTPLKIEAMKFDRILYQNYDQILGKIRRKKCAD
jgi:thermostable 8-oxoguanine DNA glycosylase